MVKWLKSARLLEEYNYIQIVKSTLDEYSIFINYQIIKFESLSKLYLFYYISNKHIKHTAYNGIKIFIVV